MEGRGAFRGLGAFGFLGLLSGHCSWYELSEGLIRVVSIRCILDGSTSGPSVSKDSMQKFGVMLEAY